MNWMRPNTTKTLYSAARFLIVGALSTLCTLSILYIGVEQFQSSIVLASTTGWLVGAVINYALNYSYTFKSSAKHQLAIPRFVIVVASAIMINASLITFCINTLNFHYFPAQLISIAFTVLTSYSLNRFWTFTAKSSRKTNAT